MVKNALHSLGILLLSITSGCTGSPPAEVNLARVGLELLSEDEAGIPDAERGRYLPCRVPEDFPEPALPPHPAGYLFVGVDGRPRKAAEIRRALRGLKTGESRKFTIRRNPYLQTQTEWWEADVRLHLPRE